MEKEIKAAAGQKTPHRLMLEGRSCAKLSGVLAVSCFDEREIVLETSAGELALLGEGLHIEQLNLEAGQLDVTGNISGLEYSDRPIGKERGGLFFRRRK